VDTTSNSYSVVLRVKCWAEWQGKKPFFNSPTHFCYEEAAQLITKYLIGEIFIV
jgi:hypothetical protein